MPSDDIPLKVKGGEEFPARSGRITVEKWSSEKLGIVGLGELT
jgi:hypothetical protein